MQERWQQLINKIRAFQTTHPGPEVFKACEVLISTITEDGERNDLANPWSREELETMRWLMNIRTKHRELDYEAAMKEVKKLLNITNRTIETF